MDASDSRPDALINKEDGIRYWDGVNADVNGMLGGLPEKGYGFISRLDLRSSRAFLAKLGIGTGRERMQVGLALEGGAGFKLTAKGVVNRIGRVTQGLLLDVAKEVDVIEPISKFTAGLEKKPGVRNIFNVGLEDWQPDGDTTYDLIWVQWCAGHLSDEQLIAFLERCMAALTPRDGVIVLKENMSHRDTDDFDRLDSCVTRTDESFLRLFKQANLRVVRTELQRGFPAELLAVRSYALRSKDI